MNKMMRKKMMRKKMMRKKMMRKKMMISYNPYLSLFRNIYFKLMFLWYE